MNHTHPTPPFPAAPATSAGRRLLRYLALLLLAPTVSWGSTLQSTLDDFLRTQTQGLPGKVSYTIGTIDSRVQQAPCSAFEPFLPSGNRLWGNATVGVRCLGPSSWTIYVPVQVLVQGNYYVSARPLPVGHVVQPEDIVPRSGDLGSLPSNVVTDATQAIGKSVKNGFSAGQVIRSDLLHSPWAVQQGQNVKTVSQGSGFSVSSEGKALNNAIAGQIVQIRTPSGQTISGTARAGGIVEINH